MSYIYPTTQRSVTLVSMLLLCGCGSLFTAKNPSPSPPIADLTPNGELENWQLRGKIGFKQDQRAQSAYLNWKQCGERFEIRLTGPLGQGAAHLFGDNLSTTLIRSDKTTISANNPEELLSLEVGWPIPVSQLLYWVRGIPQPDTPFVESNEHSGFTQSNWQINFPKHQSIDGYSLPAKAIAKQPFGSKQTQLRITLILKDWELNPSCESTP